MARVIGLTGGIASGKSTVARLLAARGAAIVDADQLARDVVEPGTPALAELVARFGATILTADGTLDRKRLGAIAFADPAARTDLGRITHPRIAAASAQAIAAWGDAGADVVFYEAALLVENRAHAGLADLVVVAASPEVQERRLVSRDGLSLADARARIAAQLPLADKIAVATWVIDNSGDDAELARAVDVVIALIEAKYGPIRAPRAPHVLRPARAGTLGGGAREAALVTGFPALAARRMIAKLAAAEPETKIYVLTRDASAAAAQEAAPTAEILVGDVADMDLGLSSVEYRALSRELTWIHNIGDCELAGTRSVLDLARDASRLARVVQWSTAMVAGDRRGTIYEEDLEAGQGFHNAFERIKYDAERMVRAAGRRMPITVLRPSIVVGDSTTGETDKLDGPYYLIELIANNTSTVRLPMLGKGDHTLNLVPIDYVVDAAWHVARSDGAAGKTFHLVDPAPMTARAMFEAVADIAGTVQPRGHIPSPIARAVLKTPGIARLGRGPLALLDALGHAVRYEASNTAQALAGTGVRCPPLADYLAVLVRHVIESPRA